MKIKVEERERNAYRIRSKLPFSVAKHRGSETLGSEMLVIHIFACSTCRSVPISGYLN